MKYNVRTRAEIHRDNENKILLVVRGSKGKTGEEIINETKMTERQVRYYIEHMCDTGKLKKKVYGNKHYLYLEA